MIVDCHSCGATYNISDEKIRGRKVRVRCKSCSEGIIVDGTRVDSDEATRVYSPTFEPAVYAKGVHDEATRVMAPSGPDLRVAASGEEWTVSAGESDQRTMDLAELISSYNGGLIPDDALVWREGMEDWQNIREVPEIQAAIESNEATHVVSPAIAVRAPRRAVGDRAVARRAEAEPARARLPSLVDVEPVAARARLPSIEGEPLPSRTHAPSMADAEPAVSRPRAPSMFDAEPAVSRPRAPSMFDAEPAPLSQPSRGRPPSAVTSDPPRARAPSLVDVNAPTRRAKSAPPPGDRTARVREGRTGGTDLFGNIEQAGGEEALLGSETLSQYDEKPIGARNESSVLFSLDALKAGTRRGSSAPPRYASNHPQTAADILGMSAGGALPGIGAGGSLLSAPAVDAAPMAAIPTTPPRSKMDTLPPMMRPRRSSALPIFAVAGAAIVVGIAFLAVRQRLAHQGPGPQVTAEQASPKAAEPTTTVAKAEEPPARTAADTQAVVPAETAPEPHSAAPSAPGATARASQGDGVTAPVLPQSKPSVTASNYEAAKAAMRVDKTDTAPKPAAEKSGDKATKAAEKVVLAEEGMDNTAGGSEAPAAPEAPPFDTAAAKAALAAAAASAASCKKDDGPTGTGKVQVTFAPTGRATSANVIEGPFGGSSVGGCVAKIFRSAKVPAFSGDAVTVSKSFSIAE